MTAWVERDQAGTTLAAPGRPSRTSSAPVAPSGSPTMPASLVTVIITTSPTPSAPSTELVEAVLASYRAHCPGLLRCRAIVVLDAYDAVVTHARLKRGRVTADEALCYEAYKANVKRLVAAAFLGDPPAAAVVVAGSGEAEYGSPRQTQNTVPFEHVTTTTTAASGAATVTFVEPAQRLGFALAVRSALRLTTTPYVWVQQHDWVLAADIPLAPLLDVMMTSGAGGDDRPPVKYVCFPSVRMLRYAVSAHVLPYSALRALTTELRRDFAATSAALPPPPPPAESEPAAAAAADAAAATVAVPLTPLFFWHDKIHLASTAHYLERVFSSRWPSRAATSSRTPSATAPASR